MVQVGTDDGTIQEFHAQQMVEQTIQTNMHQQQYHLAEGALICQGSLHQQLGYNMTTTAGDQVLNGNTPVTPTPI